MQPSRNQQPAAQPIVFAGEVPTPAPVQNKWSLEQALAMLAQKQTRADLTCSLSMMEPLVRAEKYHPRLANAVFQIAGAALDPDSPAHIQHWRADHFEDFRKAWMLCLQSPTAAPIHKRLCDLMVAYAQSAGAHDAPDSANLPLRPYHLIMDLRRLDHFQRYNGADNRYPDSFAELYETIRQHWPSIGAYWHPSWGTARTSSAFPFMTAQIAHEAWSTASGEEKARILSSSDLDWLNEDAANAQLTEAAHLNFDRLNQFSRMSEQQFFDVLKVIWNNSFTVQNILDRQSRTFESTIKSLPAFTRRVQRLDQVKKLAKKSSIAKDYGGYKDAGYDRGLVPRIKTALLDIIANQQSTPQKGQEFLHHVVEEVVADAHADLFAAPAGAPAPLEKALSAMELAAGSVISTATPADDVTVAADPEHIAEQVLQLGALFCEKLGCAIPQIKKDCLQKNDLSPRNMLERMADIFRSLDSVHDDMYGRNVGGKEAGDLVKSAFVEAGLVPLNALRKKDLTRGVLSGTLEKHPERLVEIKDLADFKRVADMFDILVDIPPATMKAASAAASQAADPLPDEKPSGVRRKMKA